MQWFDVDKQGLAKLVDHRGKSFIVYELLQNAWDTNSGWAAVKLEKIPGSPKAIIEVLDNDPNGFRNLAHAWTLFAESEKKSDPSRRGRFNLGEKLVLAMCYEAEISTTTGTVVFNDKGRQFKKSKRIAGSLFRGTVRMKQEEFDEACLAVSRLIPPVVTEFNGKRLPERKPLRTISAKLMTVRSNEEGYLRNTERQTAVEIHPVLPGETGSIYELGIPVAETGDKWHVNVLQKVPLNMDRDGVPASYLRQIRAMVVNEMHGQLTEADASMPMVNDALGHDDASVEAVEKMVELKYGEKRAINDPSDHEANMNLVAQGYTLIHGAQLNKDQWNNVRKFEVAKPSGQIAPTKVARFGPGGKDSWLDASDHTPGMKMIIRYAEDLAEKILGEHISVGILSDITLGWGACFGDNGLVFNLGKLGHRFFNNGISQEVNALLIHEFGHHVEPNHLSEDYHKFLCRMGAIMTRLALEEPEFFKR